MVGALTGAQIITAIVPMIVATGTTIKVMDAALRKNGKPVGRTHYHFRGRKIVSHRHEGGHITHEHKSLKGYGKTRKTIKKWR